MLFQAHCEGDLQLTLFPQLYWEYDKLVIHPFETLVKEVLIYEQLEEGANKNQTLEI